jgi:hypothetical protein
VPKTKKQVGAAYAVVAFSINIKVVPTAKNFPMQWIAVNTTILCRK